MKIEARPSLLAGAVLVLSSIACLAVAPLAITCITVGDSTACETAGNIVLNVVGIAQIAAGSVIGALGILRAGAR